MIYVKKHNVVEKDFISLLEATKKSLLKMGGNEKRKITPSSFETLVYEHMVKNANGTIFEGTIEHTGTYAFPDIIANRYFGVEVKHTIKNHWSSTGNSVLESNRIDGVERIYMFFGKFGGEVDIRYRLYQECLVEVGVTHSPRYKIDMTLEVGKTIFDKIGVEYDVFRRQKNPIITIKDYYKKQLKNGEALWWTDRDGEERPVSSIIKPFRNLSKDDKNSYIAECFIFFPEIFGGSQSKFERAAAYLISEYNAVSPSLRDTFTAGGQVEVNIKNKSLILPQIYKNLILNLVNIKKTIKSVDKKTLRYFWDVKKIESNRFKQWKKIVMRSAVMDEPISKFFSIFYGTNKNDKLSESLF